MLTGTSTSMDFSIVATNRSSRWIVLQAVPVGRQTNRSTALSARRRTAGVSGGRLGRKARPINQSGKGGGHGRHTNRRDRPRRDPRDPRDRPHHRLELVVGTDHRPDRAHRLRRLREGQVVLIPISWVARRLFRFGQTRRGRKLLFLLLTAALRWRARKRTAAARL